MVLAPETTRRPKERMRSTALTMACSEGVVVRTEGGVSVLDDGGV